MKNFSSHRHFPSAFPLRNGGIFVWKNVEKKEKGPQLTDFEYAKNIAEVGTKTSVDLVKLDTEISTSLEMKEKIQKMEGFSKLVHKKINEKYSAKQLKSLTPEQLKVEMEELAERFEKDTDISDYWNQRGMDMLLPRDWNQWLGLSGAIGFGVAVAGEGNSAGLFPTGSAAGRNKLLKGISWGVIAAVATHPLVMNGLALGLRKAGKHIAYPALSVFSRAVNKVSFESGEIFKDPIGSVKEILTGKDAFMQKHEKEVLNFSSGNAEAIEKYAGKDIQGWQKDIVSYKAAKSDAEKDSIASTLIPQTAEFVVKSMPQFLSGEESVKVVQAIESGNADAESLSRYSAMIFSGNYFEFFLKEAAPRHKKQFLDAFEKQRKELTRGQEYSVADLKNKFSGIDGKGLYFKHIKEKTGIRKALSKPGSAVLALYLSIWGVMRFVMGASNTVFNRGWWGEKFNSKALKKAGRLGSSIIFPIKMVDKMIKKANTKNILKQATYHKEKGIEVGLLKEEEAKRWKGALSDAEDKKEFVKKYKALLKGEKGMKKTVGDIDIEELKSCLPAKVREKLYPEKKEG